MAFKIAYKASVARDLRQIDKKLAGELLKKLEEALSQDSSKGEPLKGEFQGLYKYRIGDYRAIYTKTQEGILVLRIAHRKEVTR